MAMIYELGLSSDDLSGISEFMSPEFTGDIPTLSETGNNVLDLITGPQRGLWQVKVGKFVAYQVLGERSYVTPNGASTRYADALMDNESKPTGQWGEVVEDYNSPDDAFAIGVPF